MTDFAHLKLLVESLRKERDVAPNISMSELNAGFFSESAVTPDFSDIHRKRKLYIMHTEPVSWCAINWHIVHSTCSQHAHAEKGIHLHISTKHNGKDLFWKKVS